MDDNTMPKTDDDQKPATDAPMGGMPAGDDATAAPATDAPMGGMPAGDEAEKPEETPAV